MHEPPVGMELIMSISEQVVISCGFREPSLVATICVTSTAFRARRTGFN
jgi:hypothetical protein